MRPLVNTDKILWAVDPFAEKVMLQRSAAWAIREIAKTHPPIEIQPLYLLDDWLEETIPQRLIRSYQEKMAAFGNDSMRRITHRIPLEGLNPLEILSSPFKSLDQGAQELLSYARKQGFGLIVASTRANKKAAGSPMSFFGSFVETMADLSDIPLMVVNPKWRHSTRMPSILFPTDLSSESLEWFDSTLEFAKAMSMKINLFHKIDFPLSQPFEVASRVFPGIRDVLFKKIKAAQAEAGRWSKLAEKRGVRTSVFVDSRMLGSLSAAILEYQDKHAGLVVLTPPVSTTFPRSTIRKLMMKSPFPILLVPTVLRTKARAFGARQAA